MEWPENTHRFAINQDGKDITILLWKLGSLCIDEMQTLLHGTDYKHAPLFHPGINRQEYREQREYLLTLMMDVAQEIGATKEDVLAAWDAATSEREEGQHYAQETKQYWSHET